MASPMERRRFGRFLVPLTTEYNLRDPEGGQSFSGQCVTRDISLTGAYLFCEPQVPLMPGHVLDLTIFSPLHFLDNHDISHLKATGQVLRLDPPEMPNQQCGVAISFLDGLSFPTLDAI